MEKVLREHARQIYEKAIKDNLPTKAVESALQSKEFKARLELCGDIILVSIGKAGWEMARSAYGSLGEKIKKGIVITKYDHVPKEFKIQNAKCENGGLVGHLGNMEIYEAGHPVVDFNGICATKRALELTSSLKENDTVLFLVSGGGSALFESVQCDLSKMQELTDALLKSGANINEINTIRKHISDVKGGSFAQAVLPATVFSVVLSDVVGDDLSTIASGPACYDNTTVEDCLEILEKYNIKADEQVLALIERPNPQFITNATHVISGSVKNLCKSAKETAEALGYEAVIVDDSVTCDASVIADKIGHLAKENYGTDTPCAFIFGGEITIKVKGNGKGGRNQELALLCAEKIKGIPGMAVLCIGSDGTDGPTDAAGGYADFTTYEKIAKSGKSPEEHLENNDSYNALSICDGLVFTGATGTNVNDLYMLLIQK